MIAVIYSKAQKVRRRLIKLDHEGAKHGEFQPHKDLLHEGEGWLEIPVETYNSFKNPEDLEIYLAKEIGPPQNDACCVVSKKGIEIFVKADPAIDTHELGEIKHIDDVDPVLVEEKKAQIRSSALARGEK